MSQKTDQAGDLPVQDEMSITLRKAVTISDKTVSSLDLREPIAEEYSKFNMAAATNPTAAMIDLIASMTGHPRPFISRLSVRDLNRAANYLMGFMNTDPAYLDR